MMVDGGWPESGSCTRWSDAPRPRLLLPQVTTHILTLLCHTATHIPQERTPLSFHASLMVGCVVRVAPGALSRPLTSDFSLSDLVARPCSEVRLKACGML
jgi:hypothetical protein